MRESLNYGVTEFHLNEVKNSKSELGKFSQLETSKKGISNDLGEVLDSIENSKNKEIKTEDGLRSEYFNLTNGDPIISSVNMDYKHPLFEQPKYWNEAQKTQLSLKMEFALRQLNNPTSINDLEPVLKIFSLGKNFVIDEYDSLSKIMSLVKGNVSEKNQVLNILRQDVFSRYEKDINNIVLNEEVSLRCKKNVLRYFFSNLEKDQVLRYELLEYVEKFKFLIEKDDSLSSVAKLANQVIIYKSASDSLSKKEQLANKLLLGEFFKLFLAFDSDPEMHDFIKSDKDKFDIIEDCKLRAKEYMSLKDLEFEADESINYINNEFLPSYCRQISLIFNSDSEFIKDMGKKIMSTKWAKEIFGKNLSNIIDYRIAQYQKMGRKKKNIRENIRVISALEAESHGSTQVLEEKFGIIDFGRYPISVLSEQLKNIDDKESPYGIIMYPRADHNDAFHKDDYYFFKMIKELKNNNINLRVLEVDSIIDAARKFIWLNKKYGDKHKISFMILGGHGAEHTIQFGEDNQLVNSTKLHQENLKGRGVQKILGKKFFKEDAPIVLISCSTGKEGGIAQNISKIRKAEVHAPSNETNISSIEANVSEGRVSFDLDWFGEPEIKKVYKSGLELILEEI